MLFFVVTPYDQGSKEKGNNMSNYEDDQSEDGELARSPVQDEMDFRYVTIP